MAAKLLDRVKMSVSGTPGTGSITLGSAAAKYQSITGAGAVNGDTISYLIDDGTSWETGSGTYNAGVLSRDTVLASSAAGAKISATAQAIVYATVLASDLQSGTGAGQLVRLNGNASIPVSNGGTGLTSLTAGYIPFGAGTSAFGSSANLFWDSANNRLGIGTSTASYPITIQNNNTGSSGLNRAVVARTGDQTNYFRLSYVYNDSASATGVFPGYAAGLYYEKGGGFGLSGGLLIGTSASNGPIILATSDAERMRIDSAGRVGIGSTPNASTIGLTLGGTATGGTVTFQQYLNYNVASDVTSYNRGIVTNIGTNAASFTLANLEHFYAGQGILGAGSAIGTQIGYRAAASIIGATNNYGFYGDIPSGTGRWNFYAGGTADNYFAGKVLIGTTTAGASKLTVADDSIQINTAKTPASATATGTTGQVCWDSGYIYVCTATNTWKRAAIATW